MTSTRTKVITAVLLAAFIGSLMWLFIQNFRAENELSKQSDPTLETVPMRLHYLPDIFAPLVPEMKWFADSSRVHDALALGNRILAATEGGLVLAEPEGPVHRAGRSTGIGFSAPFRILERGDELLVVGNSGLVALAAKEMGPSWSGHAYNFRDTKVELVDATLADGNIYLLTRDGHVLEFDGRNASRVCKAPHGIATRLAASGPYFYVGTIEGEVFEIRRSGTGSKSALIPGLENAGAIRALAIGWKALQIGSEAGFYAYSDGATRQVRDDALVTAIAVRNFEVWTGTHGGELRGMSLSSKSPNVADHTWPEPVLGLRTDDRGLLAFGGFGVARIDSVQSAKKPTLLVDKKRLQGLPENYVTALAFDKGTLLIGGLNTGLSRLDPTTGTVTPVVPDAPGISAIKPLTEERWAVATTTGYLELDAGGTVRNRLTKDHGLIHNNVTTVLGAGKRRYAGTAAGLSLIDDGQIRSIYAFHGLVSNHLYALAPAEGGAWVGTLGGLCRVGGKNRLTVLDCLTEKDGLPHPWVTALLSSKNSLLVGTYGGGIVSINEERTLTQIPGTQGASINLGAATWAGSQAVFGTLEKGLFFVEKLDKVGTFTIGLPSTNVTALAADDRRLAVGADRGIAIFPLARLIKEQ
jgi:ligand-binding sensor domain-containing protein